MWHLVIYSAKASAFLAAAHVLYMLLFRRDVRHRLCRFFLLCSVLLSLIIPAIAFKRVSCREIPDAVSYYERINAKREELKSEIDSRQPVNLYAAALALDETTQEYITYVSSLREELLSFEKDNEHSSVVSNHYRFPACVPILLCTFFIIGVILVLARLFLSVFSLWKIINKAKRQRLPNGSYLVLTSADISPASWFKYIIINHEDYKSMGADDLHMILMHEQGHVCMQHSLDMALVNLVTAFMWYNPAIWMFRRDLSAIHEYEADRYVLDNGIYAKDYQILLLNRIMTDPGPIVVNSFSSTALGARISMMQNKPYGKVSTPKTLYLLVLSVIFCIVYAKVDTVSVINKNIAVQGFNWTLHSLSAERFIQLFANNKHRGSFVVSDKGAKSCLTGYFSSRSKTTLSGFLAGEKVKVTTEDNDEFYCYGGGLVNPTLQLGGYFIHTPKLWHPNFSTEDHFYIAKHSLLQRDSGKMIEITRDSFEKELGRGTNRKVLLSVDNTIKQRVFIIIK